MRVTKLQADILLHRLAIPECIAEAIDLPVQDVCIRADEIAAAAERGRIGWEKLDAIGRATLIDAVEGSTYHAATPRQFRPAVFRAGQALATKLTALSGSVVFFPEY